MINAFAPAWEFLQHAQAFSSLDELQDGFGRAVGAFGFNSFNCMFVAAPGRPLQPRPLFGRSDQAWERHYFEQGYLKDDPCVSALFTLATPYAWSDVTHLSTSRRAEAMFHEARDADARNGFIVPVHGSGGELMAVRLVSPEERFDDKARATLHAMSTIYASSGVALLEAGPQDHRPKRLSPRERECLLWASEGKSDWDIGEILGISHQTVHTLIERAKRKIGVKTRMQAVVQAWARGWLY